MYIFKCIHAYACGYKLIITNVMNFVPFRSEWMEFLVPVYNLEPEYPLFHVGSKSGQFQGISIIPVCFGKYRPKLKIRPVCVLGFLHSSQFTVHSSQRSKKKKKKDKIHIRSKKKKKNKNKTEIQVMDKAQVLPLKLTSSSFCLCHF